MKKKLATEKRTEQKENWVSKDADGSTEFSVTKWQPIDDHLSTAPYEESRASEGEEEEEKGIAINISPSDAEESVKKCSDEIIHFGNSEKCIQLREKRKLNKKRSRSFSNLCRHLSRLEWCNYSYYCQNGKF